MSDVPASVISCGLQRWVKGIERKPSWLGMTRKI
jgi:hypothetical protein